MREPGRSSQNEQILAYLQAGHSLTPLEALEKFNCLRLGGRIHDLRQTPEGRDIQTEDLKLPSGKRVARYWLPQEKGQLSLFQRKTPGGVSHPGVRLQADEACRDGHRVT